MQAEQTERPAFLVELDQARAIVAQIAGRVAVLERRLAKAKTLSAPQRKEVGYLVESAEAFLVFTQEAQQVREDLAALQAKLEESDRKVAAAVA